MNSENQSNQKTLSQAIEDLAVIRRAVEAANPQSSLVMSDETRQAQLLLHVPVLITAGLFLVADLFDQRITAFMSAMKYDTEFMGIGLALMAGYLALICVASFFILVRAAQKSEEALPDYVARNFRALRNISVGSDLLVKFVSLALVIFAGHTEWVAPLLFVFSGDHLLQGRLISLPVRAAIPVGVAMMAAGVAQFYFRSGNLTYPLAAFCLVTTASALRLRKGAPTKEA